MAVPTPPNKLPLLMLSVTIVTRLRPMLGTTYVFKGRNAGKRPSDICNALTPSLNLFS